MAKRGAEALACSARCPGYFPHSPPPPKRWRSDSEQRQPRCAAPRGEGDRAGGCRKRRREAMAGGEDGPGAAGGKRPAVAAKDPEGGLALQGTAQQPLPGLSVKAAAAPGEPSAPCLPQKPPGEDEDDAWHYNSFEYWRSPLPAIDLRDILDLEKDGPLEAGDSSSVALSEMET